MLGSVQMERIDWRRLPWIGAIVIAASAVANAVVYFVESALGIMTTSVIVPATNAPITVGVVMGSTAVQVLAGVIVFALLARFTQRPISLFRIIGTVALLLSFALPFSINTAPLSFKLGLIVMHIVAGLITIVLLTTLPRRS